MPGFDTLTSIDGIQDVDLSCVYLDSTMEDYYIIQTDSDYQNILGQFVSNQNNCSGYSLPIIDFNSLTLLGKPAGGVCSTTFKRKVIKNQNVYTYIIKVTNSGGCAIPTYNNNWITIPKILNTDSVEFQVVYAYCDY